MSTQSVFANLINFRITPTELVLEFSSFFPDRPGVAPPADLKPEVRIVLNVNVLDGLVDALSKIAAQRRTLGPNAEQKMPLGFHAG
jgi:hypothetical protein